MRIQATVILATCLAAPVAAQQLTVRQEIEQLNRSMMDAWQRNDAKAIAAHYSDDARIIGPGGRAIEGRVAVDGYWAGFPTAGRTWQLDVIDAGGTRDLAWQFGRSAIAGGGRSQVADFVGVWKRQPNGELKLAIDYWVPSAPPTAATTTQARGGIGAEAELLILDARWANAYAKHDTATAWQLFDEKIVVTASNGSTKDRAGELADIRPSAGLVMDFFRTSDVSVAVFGVSAVVTGRADWSFAMNGQKRTNARRYTATYVRGGSLGWKMVALHLSNAPAS